MPLACAAEDAERISDKLEPLLPSLAERMFRGDLRGDNRFEGGAEGSGIGLDPAALERACDAYSAGAADADGATVCFNLADLAANCSERETA